MTTTLSTMSGSSEGKRNRKTKVLSGLLSATALGIFLEGCGVPDTTSTRTCTYNNAPISCAEFDRLFGSALPLGSEGQHSEGSGDSLHAFASAESLEQGDVQGDVQGAELSALSGGNDDLAGSSDADTLGGGIDIESLTDSDDEVESESREDDDDELSEGEIFDALNDAIVVSAGDNTIEGTSGSDVLAGGAGADTYVFGEDGGEDTIVEVAEGGIVNTLKFEGDYQVSDFSFERGSHDGRDLIVIADTDGDGEAENEITLDNYFTSETGSEIAYSIMLQINDGEAFAPSLEA